MNQTDFDVMIAFAIEQAAALPVLQRIRVYRGAAAALAEDVKARELRALADDLEAADHRCREFAFRIQTQPSGGAR
jgi:hypothetical protein